MKEKFYTKYLILNTLLLILSLVFWLVISDLYMKCFVLTSLYIFSEVALLRIMCDDKKVYISRLLLVTATMVVYVIDGDTFIVDIDGVETKVRLIGVDTPESVNRNEEKNTEEGTIAANYTKELLQGKNVWIEYDQEYRDKYERILAYVYLDSDGRVMLQDMLLENGFANCMRIEPNTKYANHFAELQEKARTESAGFWEYDFWY